MVAHLVASNSGSEQEAKDIFQEAVIVFYEKAQKPDFQLTCQIKTFLYAVSRRLWLKKLAEKKRFAGTLEEGDAFAELEDVLAEALEKERRLGKISNALLALGEPCSTIVQDFYLHNLSMEDIKEKFGYTSADNAKTQKYKCLQRLKRIYFER